MTAGRIWLCQVNVQTRSRFAWETAWAALAAPPRSALVWPRSVAIGDFNHDGKQDFAVCQRT